MPDSLTVIFAGTPEFAVPSLEALVNSGYPPTLVLTQPDRPAGRGRKMTASPVKVRALDLDLTVSQPQNLKDPEPVAELAALRPDLMIVAAYGLILPQQVLDLPRLGCVNVHASLLPRWRGAAPVHRAILAGDDTTGVTIMRMDAGLDTGDMLLKRTLPVDEDDTGGSLHDKLAALGAEALTAALPGIIDGTRVGEPQPDEGVTYAKKIDKKEAVLDWTESASLLCARVRAFNPWPVAETLLDGQRLRIWSAVCLDTAATASPGAVQTATRDGVDVATGSGVLRLTRLQMPGKRVTDAADFVNAHDLNGKKLG